MSVEIEIEAASTDATFQTSISVNSVTNKNLTQVTSQTTAPCPESKQTFGLVLKQEKDDTATSSIKDIRQDKPKLSELDKFKRRLIRAVARLLLEEKKPEEEVWAELKKETSCDCKLLWTRMSALTIKKLKRLFIANDEIDKITKVAQLTVTDWLLFDLVLVHEDVDVIGQDINANSKTDPTILKDLFDLVVKYRIEYRCGDSLTMAWYSLTAEYNSPGRKCSPMLLQRRWYQMKEQVRYKFYHFWYTYRGSEKKLENAEKYKPTHLQMEIVSLFLFIVTEPFKKWETLINERRVSLFADFERLLRSKKETPQAENEPDIEVIEPHVETIDIDSDDDVIDNEDSRDSAKIVNNDENSNNDVVESENTKNDAVGSGNVLTAELVHDLSDDAEVSALESTYIPLEDNKNEENVKKNVNKSDSPDTIQDVEEVEYITDTEQNETQVPNINKNTSIICEGIIENLNPVMEENNVTIKQEYSSEIKIENNDFEMLLPKITSVTSTAQIPEVPVVEDVPEEINNILEIVSDNMAKKKLESPKISNLQNKIDVVVKKNEVDQHLFSDVLPNDMQLIAGIELEDEGIVFIDDDEDIKDSNTKVKVEEEEENIQEEENNASPKIDLKLLLNPVVYTKRLDDMDVFRFIDYIAVKDARVLENAAIESKPHDKKSINMEDISEERRKSRESDGCSENESECSDSEHEEQRVSSTSWLFRKLKAPNYNPIQLCKNPDFNTRLKWLTAGFFSSERNRILLKECKPLTIDLHKAFESKLVNGTLYLKKSNVSDVQPNELLNAVEKSVLPSELPGQSLACTKVIEQLKPLSSSPKHIPVQHKEFVPEVHDIERNKVINLPDIDQIRRINEKLLIAEVTPIQASNILHRPPVTLVDQNIRHTVMAQNEKSCSIKESADTLISTNSVTKTSVPSLEKNITSINNNFDVCAKKLNQYLKKKYDKPFKYAPKNTRVNLTWLPKYVPKTTDLLGDSLLARDTVERIISVCKGTPPVKNKKEFVEKTKFGLSPTSISDMISNNEPVSSKSFTGPEKKKVSKVKLIMKNNSTTAMRRYRSCCWARHKLDYWDNKIKRLKMTHKCPQAKCNCCCSFEYCARLVEMNNRHKTPLPASIIVDDESEKKDPDNDKQPILCEKENKNDNNPTKFCIGTNTDYDSEFEGSFAASICSNELDISNPTENLLESSYLLGSNNVHNSTQTSKSLRVPKEISNIDVIFNKETTVPIISDIRSISKPILPCPPDIEKKSRTIKPKCNVIVRSGPSTSITNTQNVHDKQLPGHRARILKKHNVNNKQLSGSSNYLRSILKKNNIYHKQISGPTPNISKAYNAYDKEIPPEHNIASFNVHLKERSNTNKVIFLDDNMRRNLTKKPICLGKNKILLYSMKQLNKTNMVDVTDMVTNHQHPMPRCSNQDQNPSDVPILIPNGVHLALMPNQELVVSIDPGVELDPIQIANLPSIIAAVQQQLISFGTVTKESVTKIDPPKVTEVIHLSDDETNETTKATEFLQNNKNNNESEKTVKNFEDHISFSEINKSDASHCVKNFIDSTNHSQENNIEDVCPRIPSDQNNPQEKPVNETQNISFGSNVTVDNNENKCMDSETIVVSEPNSEVQDHTNDNVVASNIEIDDTVDSSDSSNVVDTTKTRILSDLMEMSGISLEDTSIPTTEAPNLPQMIVQMPALGNDVSNSNTDLPSIHPILDNPFVHSALLKCPDLNVVSSFEEIKHAFGNGGHFYKMDVKTGIIAPINVCIKRQTVGEKKRRSAMPTTKAVIDLTEDDEIKEEPQQSNNEVNNTESSNNDDLIPEPVKPIKLIKAVHPSLLKKNLFTRRHKIVKHKIRKVVPKRKMSEQNTVDNLDSESDDDEPLALKAKRKKIRDEELHVDQLQLKAQDVEENSQEEVTPIAVDPDLDAFELETESMITDNHENDDRTVEPVFLNNDDSMEEDCILGV